MVGRRVHFGVVRPVALREWREHRHRVTGPGQRTEHGAHEVPVALRRDRLHRQYPVTGGRLQERDGDEHREHAVQPTRGRFAGHISAENHDSGSKNLGQENS